MSRFWEQFVHSGIKSTENVYKIDAYASYIFYNYLELSDNSISIKWKFNKNKWGTTTKGFKRTEEI